MHVSVTYGEKKDGGKKDSSQFQAESTQAGGEMFVHDCRGDTHHTVSLVQFPFQQLFLPCTETFCSCSIQEQNQTKKRLKDFAFL